MRRNTGVLRRVGSLIPPVSATELGVFRFLFALGLAWVVDDMRLSDQAFPVELHLRTHALADWGWVHALAAQPARVAELEWAIVAMAIVFAAGLFSRFTFAMLVLAITVWTLVRLTHTGAHNWSALFVTLWALLPVRWGDGFSIDALIRRLRARGSSRSVVGVHRLPSAVRRVRYGYALWVPGLVFGAAMAGAGTSKLVQSGFAWIANGSVKYHFVVDARNAPTDWGLWIASHHWAAVALSALAIVTECTLVLAVLVKDWRWRLPFAFAALGLLIGFYVFQNEIWPAWWLLCLAFFIPWPALVRAVSGLASKTPADAPIDGLSEAADRSSLTAAQAAMIVLVCALQISASIRRVEISPIMSNYPMYDSTYASVADFERHRPGEITYHFAVQFADGVQQDASAVFEQLELDEPVREAYIAVAQQRPTAGDAGRTAETAARVLSAHYGKPVTHITVLIDLRGFDWQTGRFVWQARQRPVHTFDLTAMPRSPS